MEHVNGQNRGIGRSDDLVSDSASTPEREELVLIMSFRDEPSGWMWRKKDTSDVCKPVMMWAICQRIVTTNVASDSETAKPYKFPPDYPGIVNTRKRERSVEVRAVGDLGTGVLNVIPFEVDLVRAIPSYPVGHGG